jgi:signal transduction histidine kinase
MSGAPLSAEMLELRTARLFEEYSTRNASRTSRVFAVLMTGQWLFAILVAVLWSPYGWEGKVQSVHVHVYSAVLLGGALSSLPVFLALTQPSSVLTRHVIGVAQMLWSALLIHLTGGRIETHFHVFGSLAFLAFYRDWRVLVPATAVVVLDHALRGIFWPESVYGIANPEWWRFLEHAFWVLFEDTVLVLACLRGMKETWMIAGRQAEAELNVEVISELNRTLDARVGERTQQLSEANAQLQESLASNQRLHEHMLRQEKLSSLGVLAAGIAHEINNPMAYVTSNIETLVNELPRLASEPALLEEYRADILPSTMDGVQRVNRIVADLRRFARGDAEEMTPVDVNAEVASALRISQNQVKYRCTVETDLAELPPVMGRGQQLAQVFVNLIVNAAQASRERGVVRIRTFREDGHVVFSVEDNGVGMTREVLGKLFQPFFTTKPVGEGTGLGLSVVHGIVKAHGGTIDVQSTPGAGSCFEVRLPVASFDAQLERRLAG